MARLITKDRFDLEQDILSIWDLKKDLETFLALHCDAPEPLSDDQVYNYIQGIANTLDLRLERAWDTFSQCFQLDDYCSDEDRLAAREKLLWGEPKPKKGKKK